MSATRFQTHIDGLPAGQPFAAPDRDSAVAEACARYEGMVADGTALTPAGETITVEDARFVAIQPEQKQTLHSYRPEWERLAERLLSIGGNKVVVPMWHDQHVELLADHGRNFDAQRIVLDKGERSGCHRNVSRLFLDGGCHIATGYGLSDDGYWRQHSWAIDAEDGHVIETTEVRTAYFGIEFDDAIAERWANLQLA